jgi:hypothetical protein
MIITYNIQKLAIVVCADGYYRQLLFNAMPEEKALQLLPEYGYRPDQCVFMHYETISYCKTLDNLDVLDWIDRQFTYYHLSVSTLYDIVRTHVPSLLQISEAKAFIAAYNQLVTLNINAFLHPDADPTQTTPQEQQHSHTKNHKAKL